MTNQMLPVWLLQATHPIYVSEHDADDGSKSNREGDVSEVGETLSMCTDSLVDHPRLHTNR